MASTECRPTPSSRISADGGPRRVLGIDIQPDNAGFCSLAGQRGRRFLSVQLDLLPILQPDRKADTLDVLKKANPLKSSRKAVTSGELRKQISACRFVQTPQCSASLKPLQPSRTAVPNAVLNAKRSPAINVATGGILGKARWAVSFRVVGELAIIAFLRCDHLSYLSKNRNLHKWAASTVIVLAFGKLPACSASLSFCRWTMTSSA